MESGIIVVLVDLVVAEYKSVDRLCIQDGLVEHLKDIILDNNAAVEITTLSLQIGNFRIDRNDGVRELELIGEGIHKTVFANQHVVAGARLKHNRMAVPDVWSKRFRSTTVRRGVLNSEPRARLLRITLSAK